MPSWITYARPFARRTAIYRKIAARRQRHYFEFPTDDPVEMEWRECRVQTPETCAEAIEWMWVDFKSAMGLR